MSSSECKADTPIHMLYTNAVLVSTLRSSRNIQDKAHMQRWGRTEVIDLIG